MRRVVAFAVLACSITMAAPLAAQRPAAVFEKLEGRWSGEGTLMDRRARFALAWSEEGGLAVLRFASALVGDDGQRTPVLTAAAVYRTSEASPEAVWLDSRGVRIQIRWEASDSTLLAHWTAPTENGRTTYRVLSPEEMEVVDEVQSGGAWRTFGMARYRRAAVGGG